MEKLSGFPEVTRLVSGGWGGGVLGEESRQLPLVTTFHHFYLSVTALLSPGHDAGLVGPGPSSGCRPC